MTELKMEILCKNFKHKKIIENKIKVDEDKEEYYIIPLNKSFDVESYEDGHKLNFKNQLLWLKYSNRFGEILIKEFNFKDYIVIKSKDIIDIYATVLTTQCFKRNVWQTDNAVPLNKKYMGKYILVLPIFDEELIDIKEFGIGIINYQIHMYTNEILLKKATPRAKNSCNLIITNNVLLNKEALFVVLYDEDVSLFLP